MKFGGVLMDRLTQTDLFLGRMRWALLGLAVAAASTGAHGQATATATKVVGLSAFGGYERLWPDYGESGNGFFVGGDVTHNFRWVDPSIEVRYTHGSGTAASEHTFGGGIKLEKALGPNGRIHPYALFQAAYGVIHYDQTFYFSGKPYNQDNSIVYGIGPGVDFDVTDRWAVKGEYSYQFWSPGKYDTLTPHSIEVGVVYRLQFRSLSGRR
jgi:opacity protein-like surface antigen